MKRKIGQIYVVIAAISFILFIISRFYSRGDAQIIFFNTYFVYTTMLFNLIVLIVYFRHKALFLYSLLSLINVIGFYTYTTFLQNNLLGIVLWFIIPLTFYTSLLSLFVAFWITLKDKYMSFVSRILIYVALNNYIFYTIYVTYTERNIINFFGPFPDDLDYVFDVFYFVKDLNLIIIIALQAVILNYLASGRKFWKYRRTKIESNNLEVEK